MALSCAGLFERKGEMSDQAAMREESTMRPNETSVKLETDPLNQITSPYAIRMMVRFLNIV